MGAFVLQESFRGGEENTSFEVKNNVEQYTLKCFVDEANSGPKIKILEENGVNYPLGDKWCDSIVHETDSLSADSHTEKKSDSPTDGSGEIDIPDIWKNDGFSTLEDDGSADTQKMSEYNLEELRQKLEQGQDLTMEELDVLERDLDERKIELEEFNRVNDKFLEFYK